MHGSQVERLELLSQLQQLPIKVRLAEQEAIVTSVAGLLPTTCLDLRPFMQRTPFVLQGASETICNNRQAFGVDRGMIPRLSSIVTLSSKTICKIWQTFGVDWGDFPDYHSLLRMYEGLNQF